MKIGDKITCVHTVDSALLQIGKKYTILDIKYEYGNYSETVVWIQPLANWGSVCYNINNFECQKDIRLK